MAVAAPLRYCAATEQGKKCANKATKGRFCDGHQHKEPKYGRPWRRVRQAFLDHDEHWVCNRCGKLLHCPQVDHRIPFRGNLALRDNQANLQSLCEKCHREKTREDNRAD